MKKEQSLQLISEKEPKLYVQASINRYRTIWHYF